MMGLNKVQLIGHLGRDPESRTLQSGGTVVTLNVATSEPWNDRDSGERHEKTEWHRVAIFSDGLGEIATRYLRKGSKVYVEGALQTRKWTDNAGVEKYSTEIVLTRFKGELTMLDGARDGARGGAGAGDPGYDEGYGEPAPRAAASAGAPRGRTATADLDDEIPF